MIKKVSYRLVLYIIVVVILIFTCFPFFYMISTSLKSSDEIFVRPPTLLPRYPRVEAYFNLITGRSNSAFDFRIGFLNTFKVSIVTTIIAIFTAACGAYGISRFNFIGRKFISQSILTTQVLPGVILLIPLYLMFGKYGLQNSHFGLSLAHITFALPFSTWMLKGFFDIVPSSIDAQAMIDGCNRWSAFLRIVLPIVRPGLVATSIYTFILSWNEFLFASIFLNRYDKWTLSVGLTSFKGQYLIQWNELMACSLLVSLPIIVIFSVLERYLVAGMTAGAVKQ